MNENRLEDGIDRSQRLIDILKAAGDLADLMLLKKP